MLALGSHSKRIARSVGLRLPIYPGKGYSITVEAQGLERRAAHTACRRRAEGRRHPLGDRLRVAGTVEFTGYDRG